MVIQCFSQEEIEHVVYWFHCLNEYDSMKGNRGEFGFSWKYVNEPLDYIPKLPEGGKGFFIVDNETGTFGFHIDQAGGN